MSTWAESKIQLLKIYKYAMLGYSQSRIAALLGLFGMQREEFFISINDENSEAYKMYILGEAKGALNADEALSDIINGPAEDEDKIDALKLLGEFQKGRRARDLKKELFGL